MYCKNCGTKFEENSNICTNCGYCEESEIKEEKADFFTDNEVKVEEKKVECEKINVKGIVGFCLSFSFPLLGLIFSAMAMKWAKLNDNAGKKFAVAGLVLSIVFISLSIIEFMVNCSISFISTLYNSSLL